MAKSYNEDEKGMAQTKEIEIVDYDSVYFNFRSH